MREIKKDPRYCHIRKLNPQNPKSAQTKFYSEGIWANFFDPIYSKK